VSVSVAAANPVVPYRYGRGVVLEPEPLNPSQIRPVPAPPLLSNPVPSLRVASSLVSEDTALNPSSFFKFPFVSVSVATANPVISYRYGQGQGVAVEPFVASQIRRVPPAPLPVSPVIPVRIGQWVGDQVEPLFVRPQYFEIPPAPTAQALIPTRIGQWIGDAFAPLVGIQGYQRFPYTGVQEAPSSPVIPIRTRLLSELTDAVRIEQPIYYGFIFRNGAPTPNLDRLLYDVETGVWYMRLHPTSTEIIRIT
jgi:hypothetical protein